MTLLSTPDTDASTSQGANELPLYLDCAATTPIDPGVLAEVVYYLETEHGNAGSRTHGFGQRAKDRVKSARAEVALPAEASPDEITFTSGATESNNLAILGLEKAARTAKKKHIVTSELEHKAVLEPISELVSRGFEVTMVRPDQNGIIDPIDVVEAVRDDTFLVSVMGANNETGMIQPISEIASSLQGHSAYFHVDAAQSYGKVPDVYCDPRIDLISVSGHKLFGPKGIGALIGRRRGYLRPPIEPLFHGGGQERGLRPGTLPVPLIAGLGLAVTLAVTQQDVRRKHCEGIRYEAVNGLAPLGVTVNGDSDKSLPHILNISVHGVDAEAAIVALRDLVAISNGSACTSSDYARSHVLKAMQLSEDRIDSALRFSWSHLTPMPDWAGIAQALGRLQ